MSFRIDITNKLSCWENYHQIISPYNLPIPKDHLLVFLTQLLVVLKKI